MTRTTCQQIAAAVEAAGYEINAERDGFLVHTERGSMLSVKASKMGWMVGVEETISVIANDLAPRSIATVICAFASTLDPVEMPTGTRVRLTRPVDRYPHFIAPEGATGTVLAVDGTFCVQMDAHLPGAEEWENEIVWSLRDGDDPSADLEIIG